MTAYQRMLVLAISSGFVIGALVAFPSSQRIMKQTQFDLRNPHTPQMFLMSSSTQSYVQTRVAGVVFAVDREHHRILIDAISPYPRGESTRMALSYSSSTVIATVSPEFTQRIETDIGIPQTGTRIMVLMSRWRGNLHADKISFLP